MKFLFLFFCALLMGCTTISKVKPDFVNTEDERAYLAIEKQLDAGQFKEAIASAEVFQTKHPYSVRLQKVRFQKAQALEELHRWQEAALTYQVIANFSKKSQPEISAQSLYRLSYVYEALGDNQRVLTSLYDAQRMEQYLPPEVAFAEIPARLAIAYTKENNPEEAQRWLAEADAGLKRALEIPRDSKSHEWISKTYYNMGSVSTDILTAENIPAVIQSQQTIQKYLIKAMQYNDPVWSGRASKKLLQTYQSLWSAIENQSGGNDEDPEVTAKNKNDQQIRLAGPFSDLIEQALLFQPGPEQASNPHQTQFFSYLNGLKTKVVQSLQNPIYTPLIRRGDKASPKLKDPATVLKTEDPN